jgi:Icc-related predicted phosphoesterase
MKVVAISDTHGAHARLAVPRCDLLVHCGDVTRRGKEPEVRAFLAWFAAQPARHKILVAGNHDRFFEREPERARRLVEEHGVTYLCDEEARPDGLRVWGSPVTPRFRDMAFNRDRGDAIRAHWDLVPPDLDLLVTHGPPQGLGDRMALGLHVGCANLAQRLPALRPRVHVFGHIHEARGEYRLPGLHTRFLNVASRRLLPIGIREPVGFDL